MPFHAPSIFTNVSLHTSAFICENLLRQLHMPRNDCNSFVHLVGGMAISTCTFVASGLTPDHDTISPKNGMLVHQKKHLSLLSFRLAYLHILRTLLRVASWSMPISSNPAIGISSAIPNTLVSSSVFLYNISSVSATPNGRHMYLYPSKGQ